MQKVPVSTKVEFSEWLTAHVDLDYERDVVDIEKLVFHAKDGDIEFEIKDKKKQASLEIDIHHTLLENGRWEELRSEANWEGV